MLDIESKYSPSGTGIFDIARSIIQKSSNSALAKKVLNSATAKNLKKKVFNSATAKNLKRAADSAIGQEIKKSVLSGVTEASKSAAEGAFQKLGLPISSQLPISRKRRRKVVNIKKSSVKKRKKGRGILYD